MPVGLEIDERDGLLAVSLSGELDVSSARTVEDQLVALEESRRPARIVLDLRALRFIDSTGLSLLINADGRARKADRRLTIVSGTGATRRILDTTGLRSRLDVVEEPPPDAPGIAPSSD